MKVLHIVAGVAPGGGMAESVPTLCEHLAQLGHKVVLVTLAGSVSEATRTAQERGVRLLQYRRAWPHALFFSWQMWRKLYRECCQVEVVHVHGGWSFPVWWGCWCARRAQKILVRSPRATFDPVRLNYAAIKKRMCLPLERWFLRRADLLHATSMAEEEWLKAALALKGGGERAPQIMVVPNGMAVPEVQPPRNRDPRRRRQVIYLGRKHPLKGLDLLQAAWARVGLPTWQLTLYGVDLPGGLVEGAAKAEILAQADLLVLPSRSENFGIVVAEALAYGVPVITTQATPWAVVQGTAAGGRCGWWVETSVDGLAMALSEAMALSDAERWNLGANGQKLIREHFQWRKIGAKIGDGYRRAGQSGTRVGTVKRQRICL